jgi:phospholipase/carboxylesterase
VAPAERGTPQDDRIAVPIPSTGYVRIEVPKDLPPGPAPALVVVHGYGQEPAAMLGLGREVAGPGVVLVAPEGPQAFYRRATSGPAREVAYGWIADPRREDAETRNDALLAAALEAAAARVPIDPRRTAFLGYSQGVGVAAHFLVRHPRAARAFVALAGGVPAASRPSLAALRGTDLLWVTGETDVSYPPAYEEELLRAMRDLGLSVESVVLPAGHDLLDAAKESVRTWLASRIGAGFLPGGKGER